MFLTQSDFLIAWEHWSLLALFPTPRGLALLSWHHHRREGDSNQKQPEPRAAAPAPRQSSCQEGRALGPAECPPSVGTPVPAESGFPREVAQGHLDVLTKAGVSGDS